MSFTSCRFWNNLLVLTSLPLLDLGRFHCGCRYEDCTKKILHQLVYIYLLGCSSSGWEEFCRNSVHGHIRTHLSIHWRDLAISQTHYFFSIVYGFCTYLPFFPHLRLRSVQSPKGKREWKQSCGGLWRITLLWSWDNKQWPMMIITEQPQKCWEKGKHHSAAMESVSSGSCSSWTSAQVAGNSVGLGGLRHAWGFAIRKFHVLSALTAGTHLKL